MLKKNLTSTAKKMFAFILFLEMVISFLPSTYAVSMEKNSSEGAQHFVVNAHLKANDEIAPYEIIVGLKEQYLGSNPKKLFAELNIREIEDWYKPAYEANKNNSDVDQNKLEEVRRKIGTVFLITLHSGETWDAIKLLIYKNPYVSYAKLNFKRQSRDFPPAEPRSYRCEDAFEQNVVIVGFKDGYEGAPLTELFPELKILKIEDVYEPVYTLNKDDPKVNQKKLEKLRQRIGKELVVTLQSKTKESVLNAVDILEKHPYIAYAQPSYISSICAIPDDEYFNTPLDAQDPFSMQWGMEQIQAPEAWDITTGDSSVLVGVLDTGINYMHPDLEGNIDLTLAYNADPTAVDNTETMDIGHGTQVAGIIGAEGNNGIGVAGVCWDVTLVPIKVTSDSLTYVDPNNPEVPLLVSTGYMQSRGVAHANLHDIPILNMSQSLLTSQERDPAIYLLIEAVEEYDGLFIKSAGNEGSDRDEDENFILLHELGNTIFVAATDNNDELVNISEGSSCYGVETVALAAPGFSILSTGGYYSYGNASGTSYAAPHVAGVAALLKAKYPTASTAQIKDAILQSVDFLVSLEGYVSTGGRLNAYKALLALGEATSMDITEYFTDNTFRNAVYALIDKDPELHSIFASDVAGITELDVSYLSGSKIQSLAGLEYFTSLEELNCSNNIISWLPQLPSSLTIFKCSGNGLSYLDELPSGLIRLECANNQLEDLYGLPSDLEYLDCSGNKIMNGYSWPESLTHLNCSNNKLTELDVSDPELDYLNCSYNFMASTSSVTGFDGEWDGVNYIFSPQNTDITAEFEDYAFRAAVRQLTGRTGYNEPILATDVENITSLVIPGSYVEDEFGFYIHDLAGLRWFKNLEELNCSDNKITWLPILPSGLTSLKCNDNQLTGFDVTDIELEYLDCSNNYLPIKPAVIGFEGEWDEIDFIFGSQKFSPKMKVAAGLDSTAILTSYNSLYTWGDNYYGQLGSGSEDFSSNPLSVSGMSGVSSVAVGEGYMLALKYDGTVWGWGLNSYGQLGNGTNQDSTTPVQVSGLTGVIAIDAGVYHALALKSDGTVWAWGLGYSGQLGNNVFSSSTTPVEVYGLSDVTAIAAGDYHSMAVSDGDVWAWGDNSYGQLGNGTTTGQSAPVQVTSSGNAISVAAGSRHSAYRNASGNVYTWGWNQFGQLGSGTTIDRTTPAIVAGLTDVAFVAAGSFNTAVVKTDGTVWAWGENGSGEVGKPTSTQQYNTPVQVPGITNVTQVSIGYWHMVAVRIGDSIWTWGENWSGQLGDGSQTSHHFPELVDIDGWFEVSYRRVDAPNGSGRYLIFSAENDNPVPSFLSCYGANGVQYGDDVGNYPPPRYDNPPSSWEWMLIEQDTQGYYKIYTPERGGYLDIASDSDTSLACTYGTQNLFELTTNNELRSTGPGNRYICISNDLNEADFYSYADGDHEGYSELHFYKKMPNPYAISMSRGYSPEQATQRAAYKADLAKRNAPAEDTRIAELREQTGTLSPSLTRSGASDPTLRNGAPDRRPAPPQER